MGAGGRYFFWRGRETNYLCPVKITRKKMTKMYDSYERRREHLLRRMRQTNWMFEDDPQENRIKKVVKHKKKEGKHEKTN